MVRAESCLSLQCNVRGRESGVEVEEGRGRTTAYRSNRCPLSPQQCDRDSKRNSSDKVTQRWVTQGHVWKVSNNHLLTFLFGCPHPCHAPELFRTCLPHVTLHVTFKFRTVSVTWGFFFHPPIAANLNEVHLTGRACQVQRQRRLMVDQSPMTHSAICDLRRWWVSQQNPSLDSYIL